MIVNEDHVNERQVAMWEECGIKFRNNVVRPGGRIELHAHSYAHIAMCTAGWFDCTTISPEGVINRFQVAARNFTSDRLDFNPRGYKIEVPAYYQHTFVLREAQDVGEILCMWGQT
jgi:hypothetical protein